MTERVFLAVDLGASSGRVVAGRFDGRRLTLTDVHRFENGGVPANGRLYWDFLRLWQEILTGLRRAVDQFGGNIASVAVDTWGVDYGLLGAGSELLGNPRHYRDPRTTGVLARATQRISREEIFAETGLQFMELNTLYQLLAMKAENPRLLDQADRFLMMPDLFHWLLSGQQVNEYTNASTTQFLNPLTRDWAAALLERFELPTRILGPLTPPGTDLGPLRTEVAEATGLTRARVVLPGTHDTASAVMAVPAAGEPSDQPNWCYISSGTWSLMGVETPSPVINETCRNLNFTNEGGVGGTTRLLKNIAGLWLVQECRRVWARQGHDWPWDQMVRQAESTPPLRSVINPDAAELVAPRDMPAAIRELCARAGEPQPETPGAVVRCALDSLALRYRSVLHALEQLTNSRIDTVHIVGGGVQNRLLCQMTADACDRRVVAGPVEATAIGNVAMQLVAAGEVGSVVEARDLIRRSFDVDEFQPQTPQAWPEAAARLER